MSLWLLTLIRELAAMVEFTDYGSESNGGDFREEQRGRFSRPSVFYQSSSNEDLRILALSR